MALELVISDPLRLQEMRQGPLGEVADGFCEWLEAGGFSWEMIRAHVSKVRRLNTYLAGRGLSDVGQLARTDIDEFPAYYWPQCELCPDPQGHFKWVMYTLNRLIQYLEEKDLVDLNEKPEIYDPLLREYLQWMREYRCVSEGTLRVRRISLTVFLEWMGDDAVAGRLSCLSVERLHTFFLEYAESHSVSRRRSMQAALRTFFRFCQFQGYILKPLDEAVPSLRSYSLAHIPRGLSEDQVEAVLSSINQETNAGKRDYAVLLILQTYGVRAEQVRSLEFGDVNWREDQIFFGASKMGKDLLLPLTKDVGESILSYVRDARPAYSYNEIFLTAAAPYRPFRDSRMISCIARRRIVEAGIEMPGAAAHAFRHYFATRMLAQGHSLKSIGDLLGHRHLENTRIYTKVDFQSLKEAAIDWPEGA